MPSVSARESPGRPFWNGRGVPAELACNVVKSTQRGAVCATDAVPSSGTQCRRGLSHASPLPRPAPPKHLAEKILTSKSVLEGERKQVTSVTASEADRTAEV